LAHALGATACMIKPIHRHEFLHTLDKALTQLSEAETESPANSAVTG
jgi:BarA-like signal transduction histidine kinase